MCNLRTRDSFAARSAIRHWGYIRWQVLVRLDNPPEPIVRRKLSSQTEPANRALLYVVLLLALLILVGIALLAQVIRFLGLGL